MHKWVTPNETAPSEVVRRCLVIPKDFRQHVTGALLPLTWANSWEPLGTYTPAEAAQLMREMFFKYQDQGCDWMIGEIKVYARESLPDHVLPLDGSTHDRVDYPELYDAVPASWRTTADTFTLPNVAGLAISGVGVGPDGVSRAVGDIFGSHDHTLTESEMPQHDHEYQMATVSDIDLEDVGIPQPAVALTVPAVTGTAGGSQPHNNTGPRVAFQVCIVAR